MAELDEARTRLRSGDLAGAERILRAIVSAAPNSVDALELLGASLGAQGRHGEAIPWLDEALRQRPNGLNALHNRALALLAVGRAAEARNDLERIVGAKPDFAPAWTALARAHAMLGDPIGAERAFRKPVELNPASAEALYNLAFFHAATERVDEAIAGYRKVLAINPRLATAHNNLANALKAKGQGAEAIRHYAEAAHLAPNMIEAVSNYGAALHEVGRDREAVPVLERAHALDPQSPSVLSNLGVAYYHVNRHADAESCQRRALALDPGMHEARINLGNALGAQGREREALACYREVVEQDPGNADAQSNFGFALQEAGDVAGAMEAYEKALAVRPDHPDALNNLGFVLQEEGRRRDAIAYYRRALAVNPAFARAEYNLGLSLLCERDFVPGWRHSESRFRVVPPVAVQRSFDIPRFTASDIGRTRKLAVWLEQGVGDQILYATLLPELERRGVPFAVEIDARLVAAVRRAHPQWEVTAPQESAGAFAACDRQIPIGSLGAILRSDVAGFDAQPRSLLAPDPARAAEIRERHHEPGRRLIAISWRSFQPQGRGLVQRRKSATLMDFMALSRRDDLSLLDLQYGDTAAEREAFAAAGGRTRRVEELDLFNDIDGVLAAIEACDLVITTSNVTAHFAGALGKETWLVYLAGVPPFHYWSTDASGRCLWYPSLRIVTGEDLRTWPELFARLGRDLA